ncbi:DUF547 domain-containing protein [Desulfuromonas versatilis]|uniref:DUF547 domain-containing protein n=1 Tax=Desulfuromonas versatilis TaxID=2802975 RepID=A0ABM8HZE9_9BACT|nr:DUF547 domain-containing protein [Desulfuromonas versatilis]BCR06071.1 DUF547 domain-containing protein [Desulfuromonas versatilis]
MADRTILNSGPVPDTAPKSDVAAHLRNDINRLKAEFYDLERGKVDYAAMRESEAYRQYVADTALLRDYDLNLLRNREERLAFWINIYNTLVIHGVVEMQVRDSVKEIHGFFSRLCYRIGELSFSPDDIEHGILRGNHRPPHGLFHPFSSSDGRIDHIIDPPDPRIHFTLVCASSSCPPINFYTPERIDAQLDVAAAGFINGPEVEIRPRERLLLLSPIFKWYQSDFGGYDGVVDTLIHYTDHGEAKDFLIEQGLAADLEWKEYDWRLNR